MSIYMCMSAYTNIIYVDILHVCLIYISYCVYFKRSYFNLFAVATLEEAEDSRVSQAK